MDRRDGGAMGGPEWGWGWGWGTNILGDFCHGCQASCHQLLHDVHHPLVTRANAAQIHHRIPIQRLPFQKHAHLRLPRCSAHGPDYPTRITMCHEKLATNRRFGHAVKRFQEVCIEESGIYSTHIADIPRFPCQ